MRSVSRSALVPHSADEMYSLVADVERYPEFLPWCTGAELHSQDESFIEASLQLQRGGVSKKFRTRNALFPGERMDIALVGGPFRTLAGGWRFEQLGDDGSKVSMEMQFEFENRVTDALFGHYFEETCNSLIDSFIRRANEIYE